MPAQTSTKISILDRNGQAVGHIYTEFSILEGPAEVRRNLEACAQILQSKMAVPCEIQIDTETKRFTSVDDLMAHYFKRHTEAIGSWELKEGEW